jgi:hypothetical protein
MKNKLEQKLDSSLKRLKITPRVYHYLNDVEPFSAVTIVEDRLTWAGVRREIDDAYHGSWCVPREAVPFDTKTSPATRLLDRLKEKDIYGVTICDRRDTFNRQRGRIIAKGRLLKHLEEISK